MPKLLEFILLMILPKFSLERNESMQLNIRTISTQAQTAVSVPLNGKYSKVLVKNFSAGDIWVSTEPESTQTDGSARIPSDTAQIIQKNIQSLAEPNPWIEILYVFAESGENNCVEIQPVG